MEDVSERFRNGGTGICDRQPNVFEDRNNPEPQNPGGGMQTFDIHVIL